MRIALVFTTIMPLLAQQAPQPLVLKAATRLVQVSVIAQDGKGQPINDLRKEDFRIKVNGKDQPIKVFALDSAGALPQSPAPLPPGVFTNRLPVRSGQESSVTIILLDMLNTRMTDQVYAKAAVIRYIRTLQPTDHIGIYTLDLSLHVLHDYTADSSELLARIEALKGKDLPDMSSKEPTDAMHGDALLLDMYRRTGPAVNPAERIFYAVNRILGTLKALEFIAHHLANTPGRKNLIWVSGGFPLEIGFDNARNFSNPQIEQRVFTDEASETVRALNDANMAVYPVDARGLMVNPSLANPQFNAAGRGPTNPRAMQKGSAMVGVRNQQTMEELASRTGGRAYYNSNDLEKAIHNAIDDSRVTYMLGFNPVNEAFDGKFHKIEVQMVDRKGVHLRHRKGFFDLPEQPQDDKARKIQLADASWSPLDASGIGVSAKVGPSKTKPGSLEIVLAIDSTQIRLENQNDRWVGRLDVLFVQRDNGGNQYNGLDDTLSLNFTADTYAKFITNGFAYSKTVDRSDRAKFLRIIIRDSASGAIGSLTIPLANIS